MPISFAALQEATGTGKIAAACTIKMLPKRNLDSGAGKLFLGSDAITPRQQQSVHLFSEQLATQKKDVAVRFMVAYLKGARFYNDAFVKKDPAKRAEAADILSKATKFDAVLFEKMTMPGIDPDGKVDVGWLQKDQQYFVAKGTQQKAVDLNTTVDPSFAEQAVKILGGPYK